MPIKPLQRAPARRQTNASSVVGRERWRLGFGDLIWRAEDRAYAGLLEALTRERHALLAQGRELADPARALTAEGIDRELEQAARQELRVFRAALEDARRRGGSDGQAEVAYDSRDLT